MIISKHIVSPENGTEYYEIIFKVCSRKDLSLEDYKEIDDLIYEKLKEQENE
jgi:hypothetical protein